MPPSDRDIDATALMLIRHHGDAASFVAAQRADELLEQANLGGVTAWMRIVAAIHRLQADPPAGSAIH
jgi:hypothetical protein